MSDILPLQQMIYTIRGQRVMLDSDLAKLYGVGVKVLNQAVKRNISRFPDDFMFMLTKEEWLLLRSQSVTFRDDSRKFLPHAFTEEGVAMLSTVLKSDQAIQMSINIMRAFVQMRERMTQIASTTQQIRELKQMLMMHIDHDEDRFNKVNSRINQIIQVLNYMQKEPEKEYKIGFQPPKKNES